MAEHELQAIARAALQRLRAARLAGDELAADLAETELNAALDSIAAETGPGSHQEAPDGPRSSGRPSRSPASESTRGAHR